MAHTYLLDIYQLIDRRLKAVMDLLEKADDQHRRNLEGKAAALLDFKDFLHVTFDEKLPRRIYCRLQNKRERDSAFDKGGIRY